MSDRPPRWTNWSGRLTATDATVRHVRSEEDAAAVAAGSGETVRVVGAGHSHARLVPGADVIVDVSALSGVIDVDASSKRAWVWAGTPIYALGRPLHDAGLALANQGDIDRQFIGGAVATGTHGTGVELTNLSAIVTGARIALASGEVVDADADLLRAARLHLGAFGIVTRLELGLRDAYKLKERSWTAPFEDLDLEALPMQSRHFEFFWLPTRDLAMAKAIDETDDEPEYPLAEEGSRVGWSYEVLPNHRAWRHTEMEYSVPADDGPACMRAIRDLIRRDFPDMPWAVEYRTLAADDVWLSTAYERATVTISLHMAAESDERPLFGAGEQIFRSYDGRPHWGKVNYLDGDQLARIHGRWRDWWAVRDAHDPEGTFLNDYLRSIRPR